MRRETRRSQDVPKTTPVEQAPSGSTQATEREAFAPQVRDALVHLYDPAYLQTHPLRRFVTGGARTRDGAAGIALGRALQAAIDALRPAVPGEASQQAQRTHRILTMRYVEALEPPEIQERLAIGRSEYYREQQRGVEAVTTLLWDVWHPLGEAPLMRSAERSTNGLGAAADPVPVRIGRLPLPLSTFIGRDRDRGEVAALLRRSRLVTLTGAGGCGKTRLAVQIALELLDRYPDGVWLVPLATASNPDLVAAAVGSALEIPEQPDQSSVATLIDALRDRRLLLILDNCEHVLAGCAQLAEELLSRCAHLGVLATSRERLAVTGEAVWPVAPLAAPQPHRLPPLEQLAQLDAVRLFVDRAHAVDPSFELTLHTAPGVAQICWRLDGLPLAIELAAARVGALTVDEIAARLDDRFRLLGGARRTALPHQQTLRALIDWSHGLLDDPERALLRRLSAFAGGFTLEAAEAVCATGERGEKGKGQKGETGSEATASHGSPASPFPLFPLSPPNVLDVLAALVGKSLVVVERAGRQSRYRLLETIRYYGRDRLVESGEAREIRARHRDWYVTLAERAEPELGGPEQGPWLDRLDADLENIRAALEWSVDTDPLIGARLAGALWRFWILRGHLTEGRRWLDELGKLIETSGTATGRGGDEYESVQAKGLLAAGDLARRQASLSEARALLEESLARYRRLGDAAGAGLALAFLGSIAQDTGDDARARALLDESLALLGASGDNTRTGTALAQLGILALRRDGDRARARALLEESLAIARRLRDGASVSFVLGYLGAIAGWDEGDYRRARLLLDESLAAARAVGDTWETGVALFRLGVLERCEGNLDRARELVTESLAIFRAIGHTERIGWALGCLGNVARIRGDYIEARAHFSEALDLAQTIGVTRQIAALLAFAANLATDEGQFERGARLHGAAAALDPGVHNGFTPEEIAALRASVAAARSALGESSFTSARQSGEAMTLDQAIAYALEVPSSTG